MKQLIKIEAQVSETDTTIEIPGTATLFRTVNIPNLNVNLPLRIGPNRLWLELCLIQAVLLAIFFFFATWLLLVVAFFSEASSPLERLFALIAGLFMAASGIWMLGMALTARADLRRPFPLVVIDELGLSDARTGASICWTSVKSAVIVQFGRGIGNVRLTVDHPHVFSSNPFRIGGLRIDRYSGLSCVVPLMLLDRRAELLARVITELVSRHGGGIREEPAVNEFARKLTPKGWNTGRGHSG